MSKTISSSLAYLLVCLVVCVPCRGFNITETKRYLKWHGYLNEGGGEEEYQQALELYQKDLNIEVTGELNAQTWAFMHAPQCGTPNVVSKPGQLRKRRYVFSDSWNKNTLTYRIRNYPRSIPRTKRSDVAKEIRRAFEIWSKHIPLRFRRINGRNADISIEFTRGAHKDPRPFEPFDGTGGLLGHAFYPEIGVIHLDDDERYTLTKSYTNGRTTNLFLLAAHEIGHALGLIHTRYPGTLMFNMFQNDLSLTDPLHTYDVMAIQRLYGNRRNSFRYRIRNHGSSQKGQTTQLPLLDLCQDPKIDAITETRDHKIYIFKGEFYWELTGSELGYPKLINSSWPGLPNDLDSAVTSLDGKTIFFKGPHYWLFENQKPLDDKDGPHNISSSLPGISDAIQAAFIWPMNGFIHLIEGINIWRFDYRDDNVTMTVTTEQLGIQGNVDAAVNIYGTKTIFFQDMIYYLIDSETKMIAEGYPKDTATEFFGCQNSLRDPNIFVEFKQNSEDNSTDDEYLNWDNTDSPMVMMGSSGRNSENGGNRFFLSHSLFVSLPLIAVAKNNFR